MDAREQLRQRGGIREDEIDEIIELAAALQDEQRATAEGLRRADALRRTAAELDIDPSLLDEAITRHHQQKEGAARAAQQRKKAAGAASLIALGGMALLALVLGGTVAVGTSAVRSAEAEVEHTRARLSAALDRQAQLAPQLLGLAGGDQSRLRAPMDAYAAAEGLDAQLAASAQLSAAMAEALGSLPASTGEQQRLNLSYELTGAQNRISTEQGRYDAAVEAWRAEAQGVPGRLAISIGLAEGPP